MHLNPILFPAPKRKYTPELLIGELIYIPKYKANSKPTPTNPSYHKSSYSVTYGDINRNNPSFLNENTPSITTIKNLTCKQPKLSSKAREEVGHHVHSKSAFEFNNDYDNKHSTRILNQLESFEAYENIILKSNLQNGPNTASEKENNNIPIIRYNVYNDEKDDTVIHNVSQIQNQSFLLKSPLTKKSGIQSGDVSFEALDSPVKTGPVFLEKKFVINQLSNKISKASTAIRDDYSHVESNQSSTTHSKKPSRQGCDLSIVGEDYETNLDIELAEEFPIQANLFSSPQTISTYTTKTNEKSFISKRLMTEYSFQASGDLRELQNSKKMDLSSFYKDSKPRSGAGVIGHIPCLILKAGVPSNKILMYFHGNGEDVYLSYDLLTHIRSNLNVHVLGIEYPGYGLYKGEPCEEKILADAETVFDYLVSDLYFDPQNIIVFGRSIGSGPATWLASRKEVGALALMSAFTSIRGVVRDFAGRWAQYFVKERFNNLENIAQVKCPTFIVHGLKDNFIPYKHSQELYNSCKSLCELILPREMNHAEFDFYDDFTEPFMDFLRRGNYNLDLGDEPPIDFPLYLFGVPGKGSNK